MHFVTVAIIALLTTVYSQAPIDNGLPPDFENKLQKFNTIYLEKCERHLNENERKNLNVALTTASTCISSQPVPSRTSLDFCNMYGKQFIGCLRSFADAGKGCLDQNEKYLPDFILKGLSRIMDNYCKTNTVDHIEILYSKCKIYLGNSLTKDFLKFCAPKLKIIANLDKKDYFLNQVDVCSDIKTSQECLINSIKTNCKLAQEDFDFVNSIFHEYQVLCSFANINVASFVLLAILFSISRLFN